VHFITPEEVGFISFLISFCLLHPFLLRSALIPPTKAKCPDLSNPAGHKKKSFVSLLYSSAIGGGDYSSECTLSVADPHGSVADHQLPAAPHFVHSLSESAHLLSDGHAPNTHPLQLLVTSVQLLSLWPTVKATRITRRPCLLSWPNLDVVRIQLFGPGPANSGGIRRH
jgi:hypothetical protein